METRTLNGGVPLLAKAAKNDAFRSHWIVLPAKLYLSDHASSRPPMQIELRAGDEPLTIEACAGEVHVHPGVARDPELVLSGTPQVILGPLLPKALRRVQPGAKG